MRASRIKPTTALAAVFLTVVAWPVFATGKDVFRAAGLSVKPGQAASGFIEVPAAADPATKIPVTIINGVRPGKVLALVAGVHGYEYPPVLALHRVKQQIDPAGLSGTVIMVHIANLPSFQRRTIYYNPHDWKNLNRVFPGDPQGTQTQRIAALLTGEVVDRADILIDLHCGDGNEALIPYTYWMQSGNEKLNRETRRLALAFGLRHIIIDDTRTQDVRDSRYLGNTAILRGKPAVTTESGYLGRTDEESVEANVRGIMNVMRLYGMLPGSPRSMPEPVWVDRYEVVNSPADGLFRAEVGMGYYVTEGQVVGVVSDYFGETLEEVRAPFTGILLYVLGTPPCNRGEPLFEVGRVVRGKK